jgi:TatA/E family protein of Tat protein translocase
MGLFLFGISAGEIILVLFAVLLLFGADKIPELIRSFGKGLNEVRKAADDIKRELADTANDLRSDAMSMVNDVEDEVKKAGDDLQTMTGYEPYSTLAQDDISEGDDCSKSDKPREDNERLNPTNK